MKLVKGLIHSNVFISLAAVFLTVETQIQVGLAPQWRPYLFIIFFATLFEYNLHRLVTLVTNQDAIHSDKHTWVRENRNLFYGLVGISTVAFIVVVWMAKTEVLWALAPIAVLTLFYSVPIPSSKRNLFRLREIPYLKIFLIAFVWSAVTILLPIVHASAAFDRTDIIVLFAERFLFIFAIAMPFDIRDMDADKQTNLKTIPILLNEHRSMAISYGALMLFSVVCLLHYDWQQQWFILFPLLITSLVTFILLKSQRMKSLPFYHHGYLDGTMILQGLLVLVGYYLNFFYH
ncbi:MAG: UbiA family prenyltransferase [Bacteroidetes bacterium]|nr:UbiA family prenyltransferase [Bacteroidota bacterium]